jgi:hypothetical protein
MLKTDYKDYVASGDPKYRITANPDGSSGIKDITAYDQTGDKLGAADINATNRTVNAMGTVTLNVPLDGWTGDSAPYSQTIAVSGVLAGQSFGSPYCDPTGNQTTDAANAAAVACIDGGGSVAGGSITLICRSNKPATDVTVKMDGRSDGTGKVAMAQGQNIVSQAIVTGTLGAVNTEAAVSYPEGFNADNCTIVSAMCTISTSGYHWISQAYCGATPFDIALCTDAIKITCRDAGYVGQTARLVLIKV